MRQKYEKYAMKTRENYNIYIYKPSDSPNRYYIKWVYPPSSNLTPPPSDLI